MKKLLIAAVTASLVMSLSACGSSADSSSADSSSAAEEATTTTTTTAAETTTTTEAETEAPVDSAADDEKAADSDIEADISEAETDISSDFSAGKYFTLEADETKWKVSEDALGNTTAIYQGTDIENAANTCSIIINSEEADDLPDYTLAELSPTFVQAMGLGDAFTVTNEEETTFNGYEAYVVTGTYTQSSVNFDLKIILAKKDTKLLIVCPMSYDACTEAMQDEFSAVLDTIKIV